MLLKIDIKSKELWMLAHKVWSNSAGKVASRENVDRFRETEKQVEDQVGTGREWGVGGER